MHVLLRALFPWSICVVAACGAPVDEPKTAVPLAAVNQALGEEPGLARTRAGAKALAANAYIYGYPAVLMDQTRMGSTAVLEPDLFGAPVNELFHVNVFPDDTFRLVVRPNRDTIYSASFLDLAAEPMVLHIPSVDPERFVMFAFLDAWTNAFAAPGTRTNPSHGPQDILVVGPDYSGDLPQGYDEVIVAPTAALWLLGRIEVFSEQDIENVKAIQQELDLRPLSAVGDPLWQPPPAELSEEQLALIEEYPDRSTLADPQELIQSMSAEAFFGILARLLRDQPPEGDTLALAELARIGVTAEGFDYAALPDPIRSGLDEGVVAGQAILDVVKTAATLGIQPWGPPASIPLGEYDDQYLVRALIAQVGFGANRREDAVYLNTAQDDGRVELDGSQANYVLRLPADLACTDEPPDCTVNAFWSLSIYDKAGYFVSNPIDRYILGSHDSLRPEPDGSFLLYLQASPPADPGVNWLPVPAGPFEATMRLYWPSAAVVAGDWSLPPIERVGAVQ